MLPLDLHLTVPLFYANCQGLGIAQLPGLKSYHQHYTHDLRNVKSYLRGCANRDATCQLARPCSFSFSCRKSKFWEI